MSTATFRIWRGEKGAGKFQDYSTEVSSGMVVLDAVHRIQAEQANNLAVRWNCKAGKCGSCSAEINGMPKLMCMTRLNSLPLEQPVTIEPMKAFPHVRDLVTDVSWNYSVKKNIAKFTPRPPDAPDGTWRMAQKDADRVQEFRKCIRGPGGRRAAGHAAALEMNPLDQADRVPALRQQYGIGLCNITKCCTKVCPENITITDNAIIPLKERVVDRFFDPLTKLFRVFSAGSR